MTVGKSDGFRNLTLAIDKGHYHLSGWVSGEFDVPVAQARVVLTSVFSREDYQSSSYRFKATDRNGGFVFSILLRSPENPVAAEVISLTPADQSRYRDSGGNPEYGNFGNEVNGCRRIAK